MGAVEGGGSVPGAVSVDSGTAAVVAIVSWVLSKAVVVVATVVSSTDEHTGADFRGAVTATVLEVT